MKVSDYSVNAADKVQKQGVPQLLAHKRLDTLFLEESRNRRGNQALWRLEQGIKPAQEAVGRTFG